jgi:hypothetical protein
VFPIELTEVGQEKVVNPVLINVRSPIDVSVFILKKVNDVNKVQLSNAPVPVEMFSIDNNPVAAVAFTAAKVLVGRAGGGGGASTKLNVNNSGF